MAVIRNKGIRLDMRGLALLAHALHLVRVRERLELRRAQRIADEISARNAAADDALKMGAHLMVYVDVFPPDPDYPARQEEYLMQSLGDCAGYTGWSGIWRDARTIKLKDFAWQWHHLFEARSLALSLKDKRSRYSDLPWPSDYVSAIGPFDLYEELVDLTRSEAQRLREPGQTLTVFPKTAEEKWFEAEVYDRCGSTFVGRPSGSSQGSVDQGLVNDLAALAIELAHESGCGRAEACRQVLAEKPKWHFQGRNPPRGRIIASDEDGVFERLYRAATTLESKFDSVDGDLCPVSPKSKVTF